MQNRNTLWKVLFVIAAIGALNWGLIGLFNWNLVDAIFGGGAREVTSTMSRVLYSIIGLSGLGALLLLPVARERPSEVHAEHPTPPIDTFRDRDISP